MITSLETFTKERIESSIEIEQVPELPPQEHPKAFSAKCNFAEFQKDFKQLSKSLVNVNRELCIQEDLSHVLELLSESTEKLKTECCRVGALPRSTNVPPISSANISAKFALQQMHTSLKTLPALFNSLSLFIEKYSKEPFDLFNFINMNRISKVERLVNTAHEKTKALIKFSYVVRLHSIGQFFLCVVRIKKRAKGELPTQPTNETLSLAGKINIAKPSKSPNIKVESPEESFQEAIFTRTNQENQQSLWPVSPIDSFSIDMSLNTSIGSFMSKLPKTQFTPSESKSNS